MFCIKDAVGWIGNVAVFRSIDGYILIDWSFSYKRMHVK